MRGQADAPIGAIVSSPLQSSGAVRARDQSSRAQGRTPPLALGGSERTAAGGLTPPSMAMHKRGPPGRWASRVCRIDAKAAAAGSSRVAGPAADFTSADHGRCGRVAWRAPAELPGPFRAAGGCAARRWLRGRWRTLLEGTVPGACGRHVGIEAVLEAEVGD